MKSKQKTLLKGLADKFDIKKDRKTLRKELEMKSNKSQYSLPSEEELIDPYMAMIKRVKKPDSYNSRPDFRGEADSHPKAREQVAQGTARHSN